MDAPARVAGLPRERLVDTGLAALVLVLGWPALDAAAGAGTGRQIVAITLTVCIAAAMFVRRVRPVPVLVLVTAMTVALFPLALTATPVAGVLAGVWTVAGQHERRISVTSSAITGTLMGGLAWFYTPGERSTSVLLVVALVVAAWALGVYGRARTQIVIGLQERAERLERERHLEAAAAVAQERARIMRDMHDSLGHSLSVIVVQADAARSVLTADPGRSATAMEQVARVARGALAEMRDIVRTSPASGRGPLPDLQQLPDLVQDARGAGTHVEVQVDTDLRSLPAALSTAGYRIVQESLTNVLRHAGTGATARVRVATVRGTLLVEVRSTGETPAPASLHNGTGLVAMRERVRLLGGTLEHCWTSGDEFLVQARIPVPPVQS